ITNSHPSTSNFAGKFLDLYIFTDETNKIFTESFTAQLIKLSESETEIAKNIIEILIDKFTNQLKTIEFDVILDLLGHSISEIREFGALIVISCYNREVASKLTWIPNVVDLISIERVGNFGNANTVNKTIELIFTLIQNPSDKIRKAVKIIIHRLAKDYPNLNSQLASSLIKVLFYSRRNEDYHKDIILILQQDLPDWEKSVSKEVAVKLLSIYSDAAQKIGSILLEANYQQWITEFTTSDIITLANSYSYELRETARKIFLQNLHIIRQDAQEISAAIPLLDVYWHDTYDFAFQIFTQEFHLDEFTPKILIQLCNTSSAGRDILTRYLKNVSNLETDNLDSINQIVSEFIELILNKNIQKCYTTYPIKMSLRELVTLLWEELHPWMTTVSQEDIFKLLDTDSSVTQDLGCSLLDLNDQACIDGFSTSNIITLANSNNSFIQKKGRQIFLEKFTHIRSNPQELLESVQLLESKWKDTQDFADNIFNQELNIEELTLEIIIRILESTNQDARELGSSLLTIYFEYIKLQSADNPSLQLELVSKLINILLTPEKQEETYSYIVKFLRNNLQEYTSIINRETTFKLINAETSSVQELGGIILEQNSDRFYQQLTIREIVELANHDILSIRQAAQRLFLQNLNRLRNNSQEMLEAVRILDAKWEDTREFADRILKTEFDEKDFTSDILITICDSTHAEARKIGRDLLTRNFREIDGEEYFLKFSENPAQDMQKFVTNYFEKYAANNPQRLKELTPYFITVLSSVNRNRTAKKRVLSFLKAESDKSQEAAKIIGEIISRQSASMATVDKAIAIEIMLKIKKKYPEISLPIELQPVTEERRKSLKTTI
ncbi:MAG: hypothetical protein AAF915_20025, partial [Cyanobacteria bacterium P01_D01_bin.50]